MCTYQIFASEVRIVTGVNNAIRFKKGASPQTAAIAPGTYYLYGDGTEPGDLCKAIADAMGVTCSYVANMGENENTGAVTLDTGTGALEIYSFITTFDLALIGLEAKVYPGGVAVGFSPGATWTPNTPGITQGEGGDLPSGVAHASPNGDRSVFISGVTHRRWAFDFANVRGRRVQPSRARKMNADNHETSAYLRWVDYARSRSVRVFGVNLDTGTELETATAADTLATIFPDFEGVTPDEGVFDRYGWTLAGRETP